MRTQLILFLASFASSVSADPPIVVDVIAKPSGSGWRFDVTVEHPDTGWDDYADGWRVELLDGTVLGHRELLHPHVNEQPFTRSLSSVSIPEHVKTVYLRTKSNVDGWSQETLAYDLP